jgi:hypothetical protein
MLQTVGWSLLYYFALFITFDHNFTLFFSDGITKAFIFTHIYSLFRSIKKMVCCIHIAITQPFTLRVFFSVLSCGVRPLHSGTAEVLLKENIFLKA